jgi:hypothetical protein
MDKKEVIGEFIEWIENDKGMGICSYYTYEPWDAPGRCNWGTNDEDSWALLDEFLQRTDTTTHDAD